MLAENRKSEIYLAFAGWIIIAALLAAALLPLLYLVTFTHPQVDDYSFSLWNHFYSYQQYLYLHIGGRYSANALASLNPMNWHAFDGYKVCILLFLLFFCGTLIYFTRYFAKRLTPMLHVGAAALGVVVFFTTINALPAINEGLYWFSGIMTYLLPFSLWLWWWIAYMRYQKNPSVQKMTLLVFLLVLIIGCSEIMMMLCWMGLGLLTIFSFGFKPQKMKAILPLYVALVLGTLLMIAAPGNRARSEMLLMHQPDLLSAIQLSVKTYYLQVSAVLFNPGFWLIMLMVGYSALRPALVPSRSQQLLAPLLLLQAGLLFISVPNTYFTNQLPPARFQNIIYLCVVLSFTGIFIALIPWATQKVNGLQVTRRFFGAAQRTMFLKSLLLLGMLVFIKFGYYRHSNYKIIRDDFSAGLPAQYDRELKQRYQMLRQAGPDTMTLPKLKTLPRALFFSDIQKKPGEWPNTDYARYWKKKAVAAE